MSTIPLELHEVLEEEYVCTGGEATPAAEAAITAGQITNEGGCRVALVNYQIAEADDTCEAIAAHLEAMRVCTAPEDDRCPARRFRSSVHLSCNTGVLIDGYETYDDPTRRKINRRILDDVFGDVMKPWSDLQLQKHFAKVHGSPRTALCISGGGIRSATFALGVMQGLARCGLLKQFDYLSTVSGGGYIGSWLSSWIRRHPDGVAGVERDLAALDAEPAGGIWPKLEPEAKPLRHLREYSNYLTPRTGLTSGDTWAFAALYVRNLIINLLVIVPILAFLLAAPRLSAWSLDFIEKEPPLRTIVVVADVSLLLLFWYIGMVRPVRHGAEANRAGWPLRLVPPRWRYILFCLVSGAGAAIGVSGTWATWVALTSGLHFDTPADDRTMAWGIVVAIGAMTIVPCVAYFGRYRRASYAARRESIALVENQGGVEGNNRIKRSRMEFEAGAALVAAAGGIALLWFFANKVFDAPLDRLAALNVPSFLVADKTLASPRLFFICFGAPTVLFILFLQATVFVAAASKRNEDYDREWWGRAGGWLLAGAAAWVVLSVVSIFGPLAIYQAPAIVGSLGGVTGLVAILLGRSPKSSATQPSASSAMSEKALSLAVPLFCVFLLASISWLTTLIIQKVKDPDPPNRKIEAQLQSVVIAPEVTFPKNYPYRAYKDFKEARRSKPLPQVTDAMLASNRHLNTVENTSGPELGWIIGIAGFAFFASFFVGANRFSMHALYRNRLIRAYLGASRYDRDPDSATGFDPYDNIQIYKLRPYLLWSSSLRDSPKFVDELRKGIVGAASRELSNRLAGMLQETTRTLLADRSTLDAVVSKIEAAAAAENVDAEPAAAIRECVRRVREHLPRTDKRLAQQKPLSVVLAVAKKESHRQAAQLDGQRRDVVDTVIQDLNRIIIEKSLTDETLIGGTRAEANRRLIDSTYADLIVAMPPMNRGESPSAAPNQIECRPPLHIVNTALNLVGGHNLAWQQRQAESFTISPLHSGSAFVGYRDSREYGDRLRGISLGTAVTISGASASPNQGYHSSLPLAFLLTMFNVRLGWWLGNPGPSGTNTFGSENPNSTVLLLGREMIGETNDTSSWVYLSDGGHFENLGLYEMVLRRCRYIVVSDGGCDPKFTFEDLGNAIRKIRTDLGIPIELTHTPMHARDDDSPWGYAAVGTIHYKNVDGEHAQDGTLIYLKPGFYSGDSDLPKDVVNYGKECNDFPHETTADQWFSESQFESYRMLGRHVIHHITHGKEKEIESVEKLAEHLELDAKTAREIEYVPVVAQQIKIKGDRRGHHAVILPPGGDRRSPNA